jgi:hypothetical protein
LTSKNCDKFITLTVRVSICAYFKAVKVLSPGTEAGFIPGVFFNRRTVYELKESPLSFKAFISLGKVLGPIPWRLIISRSVHFAKSSKVLIFSRSDARLAGAPINDRKLSFGLRSSSQTGQVGQSILL